MKWIRNLVIIAFLIVGGYFAWSLTFRKETKEVGNEPYAYAELQRRNVINMVSATGELSAREMVEVGTQVSGIVDDVLVDFNDEVEEGQLIAKIDHSVLDSQVKAANATVLRFGAQLKKAQADYDRFAVVHEQGFLSEKDFSGYEVALDAAKAQVMDAEATMERAIRNRSYAEIKAPISGIVIHRNVEKGQTVAASFNTPKLFTIAEDLSLMEIIADVDETDIGQIKEGQKVNFTVAAYPDESFDGEVTQLRLQPTVIQNVVNYQVVIETENPQGRLLPGMTATIDFIIDEVEAVLAVPMSALNLIPSEEMMEVMKKRREKMMARMNEATASGNAEKDARPPRGEGGFPGGSMRRSGGEGGAMMPGDGRSGAGGGKRNKGAILWYRDAAGDLQMLPVRKGVSDGVIVEINAVRENDVLKEGLQIITKVNNPPSTTAARSSGGGSPPSGLRRLGF